MFDSRRGHHRPVHPARSGRPASRGPVAAAALLAAGLAACGTLTPDPAPTPAQERSIAVFETRKKEVGAPNVYISRVRPDGRMLQFGGATSFPEYFGMINCLRANGQVVE